MHKCLVLHSRADVHEQMYIIPLHIISHQLTITNYLHAFVHSYSPSIEYSIYSIVKHLIQHGLVFSAALSSDQYSIYSIVKNLVQHGLVFSIAWPKVDLKHFCLL